jgi:hypothetical protein
MRSHKSEELLRKPFRRKNSLWFDRVVSKQTPSESTEPTCLAVVTLKNNICVSRPKSTQNRVGSRKDFSEQKSTIWRRLNCESRQKASDVAFERDSVA